MCVKFIRVALWDGSNPPLSSVFFFQKRETLLAHSEREDMIEGLFPLLTSSAATCLHYRGALAAYSQFIEMCLRGPLICNSCTTVSWVSVDMYTTHTHTSPLTAIS